MRLLIIGVGDAFTRVGFGSSGLLETASGFLLIDCPDLIHRALHEAATRAGWPVDASRIDDIIVTHLHGDHCNGLESFGFARRIARLTSPTVPRPRLHVTADVAARLWERLAPAMQAPLGEERDSRLDDYFDVRILTPGVEATIAGVTVTARTTRHPIPTIGVMITDDDGGLAWSGDTPYEEAHIEFLSDADVIVHESNRGIAHTPIESLNALPAELRRRMRLIHLPDDFDPACTDIRRLHAGDVIELSHARKS
ncbi:MAG: MBL fold metallo-hydrolase [Phycisphaerales bacterium]|nr:MBL fold metallo-hydrolase [Phycisphaerae bacterium]NNF44115.1 MBL fold metallo-hydrolase [Phycisphaerales bacterium]NNM24773.1 MBL fold metallo-hydrolase [Phycisphaerales bacterium]